MITNIAVDIYGRDVAFLVEVTPEHIRLRKRYLRYIDLLVDRLVS